MDDIIPEIPKPPAWATIFLHEDIAVQLADGTPLTVRVRQVRARQAFHVIGIIEDEYALLEYVCIKPDGTALPTDWIDTLSAASHDTLVEKARALNFPVALAAVKRATAMAESLGKTMKPIMDRAKASGIL